MLEIDSSVITHRLKMNPNHCLIKPKRRVFTLEWYKAIMIEVDELLKAGFIRSVDYLMWLSNAVLVKKTNKQ